MHRRTDGFTLVELMAVVLVIGILVAVAVPVFSAAKARAQQNTCQANQRTWAGVVQQVKADGAEPAAATAGYVQLASGSLWYTKANGPYLKSIPKCPSAGGTSYWVYEASTSIPENGALAACGGATLATKTSTAGHLLWNPPAVHQYWRILAKEPSWWLEPMYTDMGAWFAEYYTVSLFASSNAGGSDLCRTAVASASSASGGHSAGTVSDGKDNTIFWTAWGASTEQWLTFDLGAGNASEVHSIRLVTRLGYYSPSYDLQWSDSGTTGDWHTQATFSTTNDGLYVDRVFIKNL